MFIDSETDAILIEALSLENCEHDDVGVGGYICIDCGMWLELDLELV